MSPDDRFVQQVALAAFGFVRGSAPEVLRSLAPSMVDEAIAAVGKLAALSPMDRRTLLSRELGYRRDAEARLRMLFEESSHELQRGMYECLPPHFRSLFPALKETVGPGRAPARNPLREFAARRVQEATR